MVSRTFPAVVEDKENTLPYRNWKLSETFLSLIRFLRAIENVYSSSCMVLLLFSKFDYIFFSKIFKKFLNFKILYINSTMGSQSVTLGRTDGRTDRERQIFVW